MAGIGNMFASGVDGWYEYRPTGDQRKDERVAHRIMSAVAAVIPAPYVVVGTAQDRLRIVALGEGIAVQVAGNGEDIDIDVWPDATLERVRIDSVPLTTSGTMGIETISTTFTLIFVWGSAVITRHHGDESERERWMQHYIDILANR